MLEAIQTQLGFQEQAQQQLEETSRQQALQIRSLERRLELYEKLLADLVKAAGQAGLDISEQEPPPHY